MEKIECEKHNFILKGGHLIVKQIIPILLILILLFTAGALADGELKPSIDFTDGYITAEGTGVLPPNVSELAQGVALARLAAKVDAQRNLLEIIGGLKLNSETSVVNLMANDVIRTQVMGVLQGAQIVPGSEYFQQGVYHLELRVPMKNLNEVLAPQVSTDHASSDQVSVNRSYTGLAIDATGFSMTAPEALEIRDAKGTLIYSSSSSSEPIPLLKMQREEALKDQRMGTNPLIVTALKTSSDGSVIVVSEEDGRMILKNLEGTDVFLLSKIVVFYGGSK